MRAMANYLLVVATAVVFLGGVLSGCASMVTPETTKERIYVAVEQANAAAETADRLYETDTISGDTYRDILENLAEANAALADARDLVEAGRELEAEQRVELANSTLVIVRNRLQEAEQNDEQ